MRILRFGKPSLADSVSTDVGPAPMDAAVSAPHLHILREPIVVVGTGPSGMRVSQELIRRMPDQPVLIFGEERWTPYNRVMLTPLFAGETRLAEIYSNWLPPEDRPGVRIVHRRIVAIDPETRTVTEESGGTYRYSKLVLATGSRPHIPTIAGIDHPDVYTFRNLDDVERLDARSKNCRSALVIGGGLLGLEAARGLHARGIATTIVEHERWPMFQQLDQKGGDELMRRIAALGVTVIAGVGVREIAGAGRIERVTLADGQTLNPDIVVVCAGIRPNLEIARAAGIAVGRGITVDDSMLTSDANIYAVGECAEHRKRIYGLVAPGLEQAGVAAHHILGGKARYDGSIAATKLKVIGVPVFSMGIATHIDTSDDASEYVFEDSATGTYRKIVVQRMRLAGALAIGAWDEINRIQEAVSHRRLIMPWQLRRFAHTGRLWPETESASVLAWPASATVCNCTGVTRGTLGAAIADGATSIEALQAATRASTVCGTCRPLLAELVGGAPKDAAPPMLPGLLALSVLALALAIVVLAAVPPAYRTTVQQAFTVDLLWTEALYKQISGFTLAGLGVVALLLSLRKRVRKVSFGSFASWRVIHAILGVGTLLTLAAHTGFHLGENLNRMLMISFLSVALFGAASGGITALEVKLGQKSGAAARRFVTWLHILACWPLPTLLGFHIFSVYYF